MAIQNKLNEGGNRSPVTKVSTTSVTVTPAKTNNYAQATQQAATTFNNSLNTQKPVGTTPAVTQVSAPTVQTKPAVQQPTALAKAQQQTPVKNTVPTQETKAQAFYNTVTGNLDAEYASDIKNVADFSNMTNKSKALSNDFKTDPANYSKTLGTLQSMPTAEEYAEAGLTPEQVNRAMASLNTADRETAADYISKSMGEVAAKRTADAERSSKKLNRVENFVAKSIAQGLGQAPQMVLNMATGGIGGDVYIAATSFANAYNQAEEAGLKGGAAATYGAINSFIETASNHISSGFKFDGKGILDDWQDLLVANSGANGAKAFLLRSALNILGEQIEEEVATVPEYITDYLMLNANRNKDGKFDWQGLWDEAVQTFIYTFGSTLFLGALTGEYSRSARADYQQTLNEFRNADSETARQMLTDAAEWYSSMDPEQKQIVLSAAADTANVDVNAMQETIDQLVDNVQRNLAPVSKNELSRALAPEEEAPQEAAQETPQENELARALAPEEEVPQQNVAQSQNEIADALQGRNSNIITEYQGMPIYRSVIAQDRNTIQGKNADEISTLARALGRNVEFAQSLPNNANGAYFNGNNVILDERHLKSKTAALSYLFHEVTHSIGDATSFSNFVSTCQDQWKAMLGEEGYAKKLEQLGRTYAKMYDISRSYEELTNDPAFQAYMDEELAAEYVEKHLFKSQEEINSLVRTSRSTALRLWQSIKDTIAKLTGIDSKEVAQLKKVERMFAKALSESNASREATDPFYSLKSMMSDISDGQMYQQLIDSGVFSKEEADNFVNRINKAMELIEPKRSFLDINEEGGREDRVFHPFKQNSDKLYQVSMDFSTLCKKRIITQSIIERLNMARGRALDAKTQFAIEQLLRQKQSEYKGLQVACALCYVEAARLRSPKVINQFLDNTRTEMVNALAQQTGTNAKQYVIDQQNELKQAIGLDPKATKKDIKERLAGLNEAQFRQAMSFMDDEKYNAVVAMGSPFDAKGLTTEGKAQNFFNAFIKVSRQEAQDLLSPEQQRLIDIAEDLPVEYYLTADGQTELKRKYPEIYRAFNDKVRSATRAKALETNVPYYFGDSQGYVSDSLINKMNEENGLRTQSWSDMQLEHILDNITAIAELSTRGAKMHGYTKVPEFVEVLGRTGLMSNLSLIPDGHTGLDANGELVFSPTEGMPIEDALRLRDKYSNTAGTICIGINDNQILKMMDSDIIDYIIPYHVSGLTRHMRTMAGIGNWDNYQNYQNEREISNPKKAVADPINFSDWFSKEYYNDSRPGIEIMREAQDKYLELCAEKGYIPKFEMFLQNNGDGTWSVPLGADGEPINYWKVLIDRKMIDQNTGDIIEQQPVKPDFVWEDEVDENGDTIKGIYSIIEQAEDPRTQDMVDELTDYVESAMDAGIVDAIAKNDPQVQRMVEEFDRTHLTPEQLLETMEEDEWNGDIKDGVPQSQPVTMPRNAAARFSLSTTDNEGNELSQEQQNYFQDSVVRDDNGNLLVVYHGSPTTGITQFDRNRAGEHTGVSGDKAIWFTPDSEFADQFAHEFEEGSSAFRTRLGKRGEVYPVYLNMTNPLDLNQLSYEQRNLFYDYANMYGMDQEQADALIDQLLEYGNHQYLKTMLNYDKAIEQGYDGIIDRLYANTQGRGDALEYGVFNPEQIKSIDNKKPSNNPDIRFSLPGETTLFTYDDNGRMQVTDPEALSDKDWSRIAKTVRRLGYTDVTPEIAKRAFGRNGFNPDQAEAIRKEFGLADNTKVDKTNPTRAKEAKKYFGTTSNLAEAGYLLQDGSLLDFSGKKFGGPSGTRTMDHREINGIFSEELPESRYSSTPYMDKFIDEGNIRLMDGFGATLSTDTEPTSKQYSVLKKFIERCLDNDGYFALDLSNEDGITIQHREYEENAKPSKIISDIQYFYKNGELPYQSQFAAFFSLPEEKYNTYADIPEDVEGNYGYHAGDLGKAESRGSQGYYRGTGHYGTGTYFVGNPQELRYGYEKRPVETVDFSNYNLFAPQTEEDAYTLHDYLKSIDGGMGATERIDSSRIQDIMSRARDNSWGRDYDDNIDTVLTEDGRDFAKAVDIIREARELMGDSFQDVLDEARDWDGNEFTMDMSDYDLAEYPEIMNAIETKLDHDGWGYSKQFFNNVSDINRMYDREAEVARMTGRSPEEIREIARKSDYDLQGADPYLSDSRATRFMKDLGYEGIDVRALPGLDNTRYGSVIYDLKGRDLERKNANNPRFSMDKDASDLTGNTEVSERVIDSLANNFVRRFKSTESAEDVKSALTGLYDWFSQTNMTEAEMRDAAESVAEDLESKLLDNAKLDPEAISVLNRLKEDAFRLSPDQEAEARNAFGNMNEFRKAVAPLKYRKDGALLTDVWSDWSQSAATLGMVEEAYNENDLPMQLAELVSKLKESQAYTDHESRIQDVTDFIVDGFTKHARKIKEPELDLYEAANGGWKGLELKDPTESSAYKDLMGDEDGIEALTDLDSTNIAQQIQGNRNVNGFDTLHRVFDRVSGGNKEVRAWLDNNIERPLYDAKAAYTKARVKAYDELDRYIKKTGVKAGTKESAAAQWYGEGVKEENGERKAYGLKDLQQEFPDTWENIVEMEKNCRYHYMRYVERINKVLEQIYPDVEENFLAKIQAQESKRDQLVKQANDIQLGIENGETGTAVNYATLRRVQADIQRVNDNIDDLKKQYRSGEYLKNKRLIPREDYFHHFNEISNKGIGGIKNLLRGQMTLIDTDLIGKSENTKPKTKWMGFMQHRGDGAYTADAVGGLARYIPGAEFVIHMDPAIAHMRAVISELVRSTKNTRNANGLISYLTNYTNDLCGKTAGIDRSLINMFGEVDGRAKLDAIQKLNRRFKANAVGGNIRSALAQFSNIPTALGVIKSDTAWMKGLKDYLQLKAQGNSDTLNQSNFMAERYFDGDIDRFTEDSFGKKIKQFSNAMLEFGDREAAQLIWFSAYNEALEKGVEDPVYYADIATQQSVGGRGVGEVPYNMNTKVVNLLAPFQVEVNNTWQQLKKMVGEKDAKGLMRYMVGSFVMESLMEQVFGIDVIPDFLGTIIDTLLGAWREKDEEDPDYQEVVGNGIRNAIGEVVGAIPGASVIAPMVFGIDSDTGEALFGEGNPSRYGTGLGGLTKLSATGAELMKAATGEQKLGDVDLFSPMVETLLPFGGRQLTRTYQTAQDLGWLPDNTWGNIPFAGGEKHAVPGSYTDSGKLRFMLPSEVNSFEDASELARALLLGEYSTEAGREYLKDRKPMFSAEKMEKVNEYAESGGDPRDYIDMLQNADTDSNGQYTQAEVQEYLDSTDLDNDQKLLIWTLVGPKWKKNPYA